MKACTVKIPHLVIKCIVWRLRCLEVKRRFSMHMTSSIFIPAPTPVGVGSILRFDKNLILIFLIISIAFVMIKKFSFRVSCHGACFIKMKMAIYTYWRSDQAEPAARREF